MSVASQAALTTACGDVNARTCCVHKFSKRVSFRMHSCANPCLQVVIVPDLELSKGPVEGPRGYKRVREIIFFEGYHQFDVGRFGVGPEHPEFGSGGLVPLTLCEVQASARACGLRAVMHAYVRAETSDAVDGQATVHLQIRWTGDTLGAGRVAQTRE